LAAYAPSSQDADVLTAHVRGALSRLIVQHINGITDEVPVITLDPALEQILQNSLRLAGEESAGLEPGLAEKLLKSLAQCAEHQEAAGQPAVLLVSAPLRAPLAGFLRPKVRGLHVLSFNEIPDNKQIRIVATVGNE